MSEGSRTRSALFLPKMLTSLRGYTFPQFSADLTAGIIVGIVALPLAIAFAIASGVTPERGITTGVIAGLIISALGGSRVQIGGPTGAFVIIVYKIVQVHGVEGLLVCTLLAGVILVALGLARFGTVIKFIPYPLTVGFTSGIAVVIFSSQVRDFFGLQTGPVPAEFLEKWRLYFDSFHTISPHATALSVLTLLIIAAWPRVSRRIPGSIVAIVLLTALVKLLELPVETIGSRFGAIPAGLPHFRWPSIAWGGLRELISPAITVALLGAIESLLSATVADGMIESRHRSNTELIAQGLANIVTPLFGGIPATGAIARTATNVKNGGRTPVAGMVHALTLLLIVLIFGRWASLIPLCVLSAILIVVAYHMSEWHAFRALLKSPRSDITVLVTTFLLTVLVDLTVAVEVGMLLALLLFLKRMTDVTVVRELRQELEQAALNEAAVDGSRKRTGLSIPPGVSVYEAEGAFFFGATEMLRDTLHLGGTPPRVLILRIKNVLALDATGIRALADLRRSCVRAGTVLVLSGVRDQPLTALKKSGLYEDLGGASVLLGGLGEAIRHAESFLKKA
jgi:SulP family sulfate permease